ncbi:hypothetical protein [Leucobacter sp. 7(1)]|uniref:hypothetical protein n=1 Tax=Leucobacter sp. 7(1) TaxID=1255613 RepID=UPI00111F082C|nr:hypothetical protein [Leucobacter sp. 7(1)]
MQKLCRVSVALGAAIGVLMLVGCTPEPEPEPEVLTASEAGGAYLDAVCPVNAAWDIADAELEQLRLALARGAVSDTKLADAKPVSDALEEVAAASKIAAGRLDPKSTTWPEDAQAAVDDVRETLQDDREQIGRVMKLPPHKLTGYSWEGAEDTARAAAQAHEALGLPEDADAACAQWAEQQSKPQVKPQSKPSERPEAAG